MRGCVTKILKEMWVVNAANEVVEKIVRKVMSFDGVSKYRKILDAVEANVKQT